ncbi:uncharacterized protein LOC129613639 isoform X2 [Condylostylus longicornis]|uniref:uncharacterized protein LOC129613639 isoform X2 n=1 Tax=Condylostylus longicornis TaxID=2530218 RepID=UPI00244E0DCA|nr:uncharacterized protein LOC129613639 isoform X2 [Condylostylus longicornis]
MWTVIRTYVCTLYKDKLNADNLSNTHSFAQNSLLKKENQRKSSKTNSIESKKIESIRKGESKIMQTESKAETSPTDTKEAFKLLHQKHISACSESEAIDSEHKLIGKYKNKSRIDKKNKSFKKYNQLYILHSKNIQKPGSLKNRNFKGNNFQKFFQQNSINRIIELADNVETSSEERKPLEENRCIEIDLENPFNLDYHGLDYQNTYKNDEQNFQNIREYRKIKRYANRIQTKKNIDRICKEEDEIDKFAIPPYFSINISYDSNGDPIEFSKLNKLSSDSSESFHVGPLYRTEKKPINRFIIKMERKQREGRYRNLIERNKEYNAEIEKIKKKTAENFKQNKTVIVAEETFNKFYNKKSFNSDTLNTELTEKKTKIFPCTLPEMKKLKHKMKVLKFIDFEKCKLRKRFFNNIGTPTQLEETKLFSMSLSEFSNSEQSNKDDDNIEIKREGEKYYLEGFHYRTGNEICDKYSKTDKSVEVNINRKVCSRLGSSFLKELNTETPKYNASHNRSNFQKSKIYPSTFKPARKTEAVHPLREVAKPFGEKYKFVVKRNIECKKPKANKIKKFNLYNYIFSDDKTKISDSTEYYHLAKMENIESISEYIRNKKKFKNDVRRQKRKQRLKYLGISYKPKQSNHLSFCRESSESEDSDWVPKEYKNVAKIDCELLSKENLPRSNCTPFAKNTLTKFKYMPAPRFRESTLQRNPNNIRDLNEQVSESVILEEEHTKLPYLKCPESDKNIPMKLGEPKKNFMTFLKTRHHHEHHQATQHKDLKVLFKPKYPKISQVNNSDNFEKTTNKANTQLKNIFKQISASKINNQNSVSIVYKENNPPKTTENQIETKDIEQQNILEQYHNKYESVLCFPDIDDFHLLIEEIQNSETESPDKEAQGMQFKKVSNLLDKNEIIKNFTNELESIKSCLSSLDSSICTNFTNDSGSFLMATNKKIPLDFLRKSVIPFEETNRTRIKAIPIPLHENEEDPYKVVHFAGQKTEEIKNVIYEFHTFSHENRKGIRDRIFVPLTNISKVKLGLKGSKKYTPKYASDLDEIYIKDLEKGPVTKIFRRSSAHLLKTALRKKYICWCIQQKLLEQKSVDEKQLLYYINIEKMKNLFNNFFFKLQKMYYDKLKEVEYEIEPNYLITKDLRNKLKELEKEMTIISMNIICIENKLNKLVILQNFQYLLKDEKWRIEHDWLHKKHDGALENYRDSIEKRSSQNVLERNRDDVWAIKKFYEKHFVNSRHPVLICFPNATSFNSALKDLESKTFTQFINLNSILIFHANLQNQYNQILVKSKNCHYNATGQLIRIKDIKQTFMLNRNMELQKETQHLSNEPLAKSVASTNLRTIKAFVEVLYKKLVPWSIRQSMKEDVSFKDQTTIIWEYLLNLLAKIDEIPKKIRDSTMLKYRRRLKVDTSISKKAVEIENRITTSMNTVQMLLKPPKLKDRKETLKKYSSIKLKKKRETDEIKEEPIPEKIQFFYEALHDIQDMPEITKKDHVEIEEILTGIEEESITFHFDHFLRINDYEPDYNYKTQIEIIDGSEENYFKYEDVIPYVKQQVEVWEKNRIIKIKQHIEENQKLYTDIKT